jgi:methylthioribose-1-phosphate isomerase
MSGFQSIRWEETTGGGSLVLLDQRRLPFETLYLSFETPESVAQAIRDMVVRGAPAIGVTAAYGLCLPSLRWSEPGLRQRLDAAFAVLAASRPTAVNLFWALERMRGVLYAAESAGSDNLSVRQRLLDAAHALFEEDRNVNIALSDYGVDLLPDKANLLHHCNTGSLATVEYGTALGIIRRAHERGKQIHAYLSETRPRLQGASLSAYEMATLRIPYTVLVDGAAAYLMQKGNVDAVVVGCDRVAANGDTANKIGTYMHALCAKAHGIPFYVAMPTSTLDISLSSGADIPVEERPSQEVTEIRGVRIAPEGTKVWNPAFDITPGGLVTGFITERGVLHPPFTVESIQK